MLDLLLVQDFDTDRLRTEQKGSHQALGEDGGVLVQGGRPEGCGCGRNGTGDRTLRGRPDRDLSMASGIEKRNCPIPICVDRCFATCFSGSSWRKQIQNTDCR